MSTHPTPRPVLITTAHRGVFAGLLVEDDGEGNVTLDEVRICVYWPAATRGVVGLAVTGPPEGARVSPAASRGLLRGVTSVMDLTEAAWAAWRAEPWS